MQIAKKERVDLESLSGTIERITFHSEESGFAVLRVKVSKKRDLLTVTGNMPFVAVGEYICAKGVWCNDSKHGLQFKAEFLKAIRANTLDGIEKYLGSGLIKGIGPHFAKKLVLAFKEKVFDVIEESADLLSSIPGIGKIRASTIINSWAAQKVVREIMVFLQSHGVSTAKATRIYKTYGEDAIQIVSENPYRLAKDIHGIGFLSADKIAMKLGIEECSCIRARAGINYTLMDSLSEGNCGLVRSELLQRAEKLLAIPYDILLDALEKEIAEQSLVTNIIDDKEIISLSAYAAYENSVASSLKAIACGIPVWSKINIEKAIEWVEKKLLINLALNQKEAIKQVIKSKVTVITGGPGTGKTTLLSSLVKILNAAKYKVLLSAPTGRAAKRL